MAVASAGPYASLHLAPDRQSHQHPTTLFLQAGCPSCRPTNSVEALKAVNTLDTSSNICDIITSKVKLDGTHCQSEKHIPPPPGHSKIGTLSPKVSNKHANLYYPAQHHESYLQLATSNFTSLILSTDKIHRICSGSL